MIPKKIHYCWFGRGVKPKLAQRCIASWKKHCPDYEIIEWNEDNFNVNMLDYTKFCYENRCFAFLSDYVRLWTVEKYGGIYFDTDVELVKSPSELLKYQAYFGFEGKEYINTGLGFGSEAGNPVLKKMLEEYERRAPEVYRTDFQENHKMTGSPKMNTAALIKLGFVCNGKMQEIQGNVILPEEYLCPFDDATGTMKKTQNTVSIHWYGKSPHGKKAYIKSKISRPIHRVLSYIKKQKEKKYDT